MKRSTRKDENKAKKAASEAKKHKPKREVPAGFRKLVVDDAVYGWRQGKVRTEIRLPGKLDIKWVVPTWQLQGYTSQEAWEEEHKDCCTEGCCEPCTMWSVTPGMIRKYIDEVRKATCTAQQ